ncbi:MAG: hypothetical protein DI565_09180 [Ancylobacter novellus]|uniref:Uncharacterized protein n=1 Tax=Ancylobacter novellus TaxID=921 RepID=A0A2W5KJL6_ANCNO|nr:MAG: hypothetical protein DI565_09180 [Ancylobacter novellus]
MTDSAIPASAEAKTKKTLSPEQQKNRQIYRILGKALFTAASKGADKDKKENWSEVRTEYSKQARTLARTMEKQGLKLELSPEGKTKTKKKGGAGKDAKVAKITDED